MCQLLNFYIKHDNVDLLSRKEKKNEITQELAGVRYFILFKSIFYSIKRIDKLIYNMLYQISFFSITFLQLFSHFYPTIHLWISVTES